jgi:hypothetical protein
MGRVAAPVLSDFEKGVVVGLLITQGSFGGDGKTPQIVLKLHVDHERLLRRLVEWFPRTRLYGPYHHVNRHFFQWMARGPALVLDVLPLLEAADLDHFDHPAAERLATMTSNYAGFIARTRERHAA